MKRNLTASLLTLPLLLASCGGSTPGTVTGGNTGGGNAAPTVSFTGAAAVTGTSVSVPVRVGDDKKVAAVDWVLDAGRQSEQRGSFAQDDIKSSLTIPFAGLGAGQHTLTVTAKDEEGKATSVTHTFTVDAAKPTIGTLTVNGNSVAENATLNLAADVPAQISAVASDDTGATRLQLFQGTTLIEEGNNTLNAQVTPPGEGVYAYELRATDRVGNVTSRTFTINYAGKSTELPAPRPVIRINNVDPAPYSDILSVSVSAGLAAGAQIDRVILEVTDSRGSVDTSTFVATSENPTFSVDTTKYPDGTLTLRAVAIDKDGRRGSSETLTTSVKNSILPTLTIVSPSEGATVRGPTTITVQLKEENTPVTLETQEVNIQIYDERGQLVTTRTATLRQSSRGLWQASTTVDFTETQFIVTSYTIRASVGVTLAGDPTVRTVEDTNSVTNNIRSTDAPALNIIMPAFYGELGVDRPVLSRRSAVALQISDSDNIVAALLTFTCDTSVVSNCTSKANSSSYQYQIPIGGAGVFQRLLNMGFLMDAQPLLPDGDYIMRLTARDQAGNENIREMPVKVDRSVPEIVGLDSVEVEAYENSASTLTPAAASWTLVGNRVNPVRVMRVVSSGGTESELGFINSPLLAPSERIGYSRGFSQPGVYTAGFLVQDLVTGAIEYFPHENYAVYVSTKLTTPAAP